MNSNVMNVMRLNAHTFPVSQEEREILAKAGLSLTEIEGDTDEEITKYSDTTDAVMIVSAYLKAPVIEKLKRCRIISRLGTGVDKIDIAQATRQGIMVTNVPDFCTEEVADHTMALLLSAARDLKNYESEMRTGRRGIDEHKGVRRLSTQTTGLVGFGRIGRAVARRARAFGMKILVSDPFLSAEDAEKEQVSPASLEQVLSQSDYVVMMCPLLPSTRKMITMNQFKMMKPTAVFVNTSRGELVDENDLAQALKDGVIQHAALDVFGIINVFSTKGFSIEHPLFGLKNVTITPHVAAFSPEAMQEGMTRGAMAVIDVLSGKWPKHPVNPDVKPWFQIRHA